MKYYIFIYYGDIDDEAPLIMTKQFNNDIAAHDYAEKVNQWVQRPFDIICDGKIIDLS